jgi:hypothetical protein
MHGGSYRSGADRAELERSIVDQTAREQRTADVGAVEPELSAIKNIVIGDGYRV